jgi:hypothetical protein
MAESGLLGSRCSPGTQEIKIFAWGKVDVDRTEKSVDPEKNILGFKNLPNGW